MDNKIYYGKGNIALYRSYAHPLTGLNPIPESPYTGQENTLFAVDLQAGKLPGIAAIRLMPNGIGHGCLPLAPKFPSEPQYRSIV